MRQKLTITDVLEQRTIGDKNIPLQEFNANGKKYSVFSKSLFPYIKLNTEIDAEVEIKSSPSGEWTNYKVTDIFVNGQSAKGQQQGGYRGKSPEELELSSRSFALSYAKDLAVADKIKIGDILDKATEFSDWLTVKPTAVAVKETGGLVTPKGEEPRTPLPGELPGLATKTQKDALAKFDTKRIAEIMNERGFPKKLTKLNADILLSQLTVEEATKDLAGIPEEDLHGSDG